MVIHAYWDTSCVLKLYCEEKDSAGYLRRIAGSPDPVCSSVLLAAELAFAFHQKEHRGEIREGASTILYEKFLGDVDSGRFLLIPMGDDVRKEARRIAGVCYGVDPPILLRTLDGLHLASATLAGCREILTTDDRMQKATRLLGKTVGD
jgi:predicted nucleic acid-binding protein